MIAALNARYDAEYTQFESRISEALYAKDKQLSEMEEQMRLQRAHCDEIERELEEASRERLTQERMLREARGEREQARKAMEAMKGQVGDY